MFDSLKDQLLGMRMELQKQAEIHFGNWQATLGAMEVLEHLAQRAEEEGWEVTRAGVDAGELSGIPESG